MSYSRSDSWNAILVAEALPMVQQIAKKLLRQGGIKSQVAFEDLLQQGALGAARAARRYRLSIGPFPAFARSAVLGEMQECFRRRNRDWTERKEALAETSAVARIDQAIENSLLIDAVNRVIEELPARDRVIVQRYFLDECTQREIAQELEMNERHVSRLRTLAISHIQERLSVRGKGQAVVPVLQGAIG